MPAPARRRFLSVFASLAAGLLPIRAVRAQSDPFASLVREVTGGAPVWPGRVKVDIPLLADNGHSVPLKVSVASPMTAVDHVRSIILLSEKNPRPVIAKFHFGPGAGRAEVATRVRLNGAQRLLALAQFSDGSFWSGGAEVVVTESACLDES
ncbi:MAG: sulfur oxidation protein SoxY [Betaproteobacteria bacterium]|nr:MAG: sulfur oxidation protein SoxY [Betaproteobacteria bacterium]